ncbi:MAG: hypothetical protein CSA65_08490 [Proteobacteria bacterium]|nr:MAG: hypothetical protein CSA65_08490 [Pseudomonadota bacterium]
MGTTALAGLGGCSLPTAADPGERWLEQARIAGQAFFVGFGDRRLEEVLDTIVASGASVIEGDSNMSDLLSPMALGQTLDEIAYVTEKAHERNLKVVWYYPALEVITPNGELQDSSMFKDNPSWVQYNIEGKPNVFYGSKEHWVDPGAESAWMCHNSPYRDFFFDRVRRLGHSGVDGVWCDVPLYMDTVVRWVCTNPYCNDKFLAETGYAAPTREDWDDVAWRRWIHWRHVELDRFCRDIYTANAAELPNLQIICETVPLDYNQATVQALAGDFLGADAKNVGHVWEVDSVSNDFGMKPANHDDWLCKIRMFKFAKGCDRGRYCWVFTYGHQELDAGLVMAAAVAAGCAPYETQTPKMTTTVGVAFRKRMFSWIAKHQRALFDAAPAARAVVIQSSSSRDYSDQGKAEAMYASLGIDADETYWQHNDEQLLSAAPYLSEYTGICKVLSHAKVPFLIQPIQTLRATYLEDVSLVIAPSLACISDAQAALLLSFVRDGGTLLFTGDPPGEKDEYGALRGENAFAKALVGLGSGSDLQSAAVGRGRVYLSRQSLGRRYLNQSSTSAFDTVKGVCDKAIQHAVEIDGPPHVHSEHSVLDTSHLIHLVNYQGAMQSAAATSAYPFTHRLEELDAELKLRFPLPAGAKVNTVRGLSPDPQTPDGPLPYELVAGVVTLSLRVVQYRVVEISLTEASS